ncbi:MAG: ribonuclease P protein component [Opitutales bacterium]|nr:ribonuclease P protein component [Opitutales bacterium]
MNSDAQRRGLHPSNRLRTTGRISAVREKGRGWECGPFRIQWHFREPQGIPLENEAAHPRFAVIASRRVGGAVARNRCKRRLRELFRLHQHDLPPLCDLVFIARRRLLVSTWPEVRSAFERGFEQILRSASPKTGDPHD